MKRFMSWCFALLIAHANAFAWQSYDNSNVVSAPSPASATLADALMVSFEIKNFNYFDLSVATCPKKVKAHDESDSDFSDDYDDDSEVGNQDGPKDAIGHIVSKTRNMEKRMAKGIEDGAREMRENMPSLPWTKNKGATLLEVDACVLTRRSLKATKAKTKKCETVMDVFRSAIKEVVSDIIACMSIAPDDGKVLTHELAAAGPATALQPQATAFLRNAAPAPVPTMSHGLVGNSNFEIMVSFSPGEAVGSGKSIIVDIGILSAVPGGSMAHLQGLEAVLHKAIASGALAKEIEQALQLITGITAKLGGFVTTHKKMAAFDMAKCEAHVKSIVTQFSRTYTKERVPMALYNECTNFITKLSFSHDHILDPRDTAACKETTASFAKHWKFGEKAEDYDFEFMCKRACEAKLGEDSKMCKAPGSGPGPAPAPAPEPVKKAL